MSRQIVVAVLAAVAFAIAIYMALYQWRVIADVWDPLGGAQTRQVLDSRVSQAIRSFTGVPDSALGALAYAVEIVLAVVARPRWGVILYGLCSLSLALAGLTLVAMQIFVLHAICFLCFCTATLSIVIFAFALPDVIPAVTRPNRDRAAAP